MRPVAVDLDATIRSRAVPDPVETTIELVWDPSRPLDVELIVHGDSRDIVWLVGRDLLAAGVDGPAGGHDVTVTPAPFATDTPGADDWRDGDGTDLLVILASPSGCCEIRTDRMDVDMFLSLTRWYVPVGGEVLAFPDTVPGEWLTGDGASS